MEWVFIGSLIIVIFLWIFSYLFYIYLSRPRCKNCKYYLTCENTEYGICDDYKSREERL